VELPFTEAFCDARAGLLFPMSVTADTVEAACMNFLLDNDMAFPLIKTFYI